MFNEKKLRYLLNRYNEMKRTASESEIDRIIAEIVRLSPDPEISDYIFYSDDYVDEAGNLMCDDLIQKVKEFEIQAL